MKLPQLTPIRILKRLDDEIDPEIWQPNWSCHCCHDTGLIVKNLVRRVMAEFEDLHDLPVLCQRPGCYARREIAAVLMVDERFTPEVCAYLHEMSVKDWNVTARAQQRNLQVVRPDLTTVAAAKEMPGTRGGRTEDTEREIRQKQEDIENTPLEEWLKEENEQSHTGQ